MRFERVVHRVFGGSSSLRPSTERLAHRRRGLAALARVRLVDDDGEGLAGFGGDLVEDERELLHRRDDDLLALLDEPAQVARCSAWPTVAPTCMNCLIVVWIWSSSRRRSVTTITESKTS
jgi:hypothetical protein